MRIVLVLCVLASSALGGAAWLPVEPYVDPSQLEVPWPKHSHVKQPWRGFLETKPTVDLLAGLGVAYHPHGEAIDVQLGLLATAGIRCLRWEQPFGTYDPDRKRLDHSEGRFREVLRACKRHAIVPIVLLNAHHGVPCKLKYFPRRLTAEAPKGSRELLLDSVEGLRPVHSGTNGLTGYWAGEVLFTEIDKTRKAVKLSKPLLKALKKGDSLTCVDLHYLPLHPVGTPQFEHTAGGWVDYARAVCRVAKEEGVVIELEVWNELSFGSHFAGGRGINAYWPGRATFTKDFLRPGGHAWEMTRRTVDMARREFPTVCVIWGWSNTTFFHTPIEQLPPGIDGQSYHPYGTGWRELPQREQAPHQPWRCLEGHCPACRLAFPEGWAHTFIQCESLMHLLRPDKRLARRPKGTTRFRHYITEHGIVPAEVGVKGDAASLRLKEKFLLRAVLFWLNKGIDRIFLFHGGVDEHDHGMGLSLARVRGLKALPPEGQRDAWLSPAWRSLRRAVARFRDGAVPIAEPRPFTLQVAKHGLERKVFEMPGGKRPLYFRDLFAVLPFQVNPRRFIFAVYVMTPTYPVEDPKEVTYRVTIRPVAGAAAKVSFYDPLADRPVPVRTHERGDRFVTLDLPTLDTPRLLVVDERPEE